VFSKSADHRDLRGVGKLSVSLERLDSGEDIVEELDYDKTLSFSNLNLRSRSQSSRRSVYLHLPSMVLSQHSLKKSLDPKAIKEQKAVKGWAGVKEDELGNLDQTIRERFKWPHTPRKFQLDAITFQLLRKDVVVHAGMGFRKTAIAAGPHAHEKAKRMVTFMVSPLIALQEEQVGELNHL
jgi:hypothetical protein